MLSTEAPLSRAAREATVPAAPAPTTTTSQLSSTTSSVLEEGVMNMALMAVLISSSE